MAALYAIVVELETELIYEPIVDTTTGVVIIAELILEPIVTIDGDGYGYGYGYGYP